MPELGFIALLCAAAIAVLQCVLPGFGIFSGRRNLISAATPLAFTVFCLALFAMVALTLSLATDDFSLAYAAQHSNSRLPLFFKIAAAWGGHEGSILLLVVTLALWGALVAALARPGEEKEAACVLMVLGGLTAAFALFTALTSSPFVRMFPPAFEGRDLNPMLQDVALIFHPPLLYIGYAGFAVSFAYAMTMLLLQRMDGPLLRRMRAWSVAAWAFLTAGIALGAWWAYFELGWGGWWFWDPAENSSLMPWLLGTALVHVLAVTERRGAFGLFALLLAIFTFALSTLGTFIVRSGILSSVHAFANDPGRGLALLLILTAVLVVVLSVFALRADFKAREAPFRLVSRESALAATGALFTVACGCVMIGTFYPMIYTLAGLGSLSVGAPYFNAVFKPLFVMMLLLLPLAPVLHWQEQPRRWLLRQLPWLTLGGIGGAWLCLRQPLPTNTITLVLCMLAGWAIFSHAAALTRIRSLAHAAPLLCHLGVGIAVVGAAQLAQYSEERWLSMTRGTGYPLGGYVFTLEGSEALIGANYTAEQLFIRVDEQGSPVATLKPESRYYSVRTTTLREPGVASRLGGDLYATFGEKTGPGSYTVHLQIKPMASWLWLGAILMVLGGIIRLTARRQPQATDNPALQPLTGEA